MKILSTALLCISIIVSIGGSAYYLKQEPKTLIETNYGSVNLGQVFAESVLMTVEIDGFSGHQDYDVVLNQGSFFEAKKRLWKEK
ncbi:hypothetical protein NDN13_01485 [Acinetobacter sp. C32I]|uniref:hypothetical protein n=1 Tax=Acinetobacter sp. C32I TaxID=2950074 RepID=UPI00203737C1|nr:hypothetical protein [Acinetobacter sp. C32I]USA53893.1 hypothetical protein NDN13_01485 [Acinetobacter sp. C32I]